MDPALYNWIVDGLRKGLPGSYVDDIMRAGDNDFNVHAKKAAGSFEMATDEKPV